uniref:C2H2-type domain-containing protein n=1 Tax=Oryza nivara TaxID=4536 RepID=A0A0E0ICJ8_ORYNI
MALAVDNDNSLHTRAVPRRPTPCSFIRRLRATDGLPPSDGTKMTSCLIQRLAVTPCTGPKASKLVLPPLRSARLPSPEAEPSRRSSAAEKPSRFPHHLSHHNQTLTPPTPTMEFARRATAPVDADDGCGVPHPSPRGQDAQKGVIWSEEEKGCRYFPDEQQKNMCAKELNEENKALESRKEAIGTKKKVETESLSVTRHYPPTWNYGICKANCSSELDLKNHLRGRRHQENLEALKREDKEMEAKVYAKEVAQFVEKNQKFVPRWSCSTCKANCTSASDLENHFRGRRHQQNVGRSSNVAMLRA